MPRSLRRFIHEASCAWLVAREFATSDLAVRLRDTGWGLGADRDFWRTPPVVLLFLHRKAGGLCMLATKLKGTPAGVNQALKGEEGMKLFLDYEFTQLNRT